MNNFKLNDSLNKNKVFLVKRSEIEDRLDPLYYSTIEKIQSKIVSRSKYDVSSVKNECNIIRGRFGHRPRNDPAYYNGKYPFIQTGDVVIASDSGEKIKYSQTLNELGLSTSKLFKANQLLFTIAANIGDTAILDYDACFPDSIVSIEPKNSNTSIEYLNIYFKLIKHYIYDLAPFAAQRNLNNKQLEEVPIIIPPISLQTEIINLFNDCIKTRQSKQSQAKALLKSIDLYLLNELGIELPQKDDSLKARIFTTKFSDICGSRLDPKRYCTAVEKLKDSIENSKYETHKLCEFITESISGDWGIDEDEISEKHEKCLVIRATEFDNDYNLNIENTRVKYRQILISKLKKMNIKKDDLLIEKSGGSEDQSVGRVAIITNEIMKNKIAYSNFIHKISLSNIYPEYLFCYLKTAHNIKLIDTMQSQTNGIRNLIMQEYFNQTIPLPPLSKQIEIAEHIKEIRSQAKQLEIESEQILTDAKKEIEKMILGE